MATRLYSIQQLNPFTSLGTWTLTQASNLIELVKTPANDTSVLTFEIPRDLHGSAVNVSGISAVAVHYVVATASLDAAPTVTVNKVTMNASTKAISRAAVSNTLTFAGTNTVGTAAGTYVANIAFAAAAAALDESSAYTVEVTFNGAATGALKVGAVEVTYV